ncbi:MAG TPA: glycosyltransferase [Candidatus Hydrogenedentes bacterium]|nr:glycosyltransferase [Candidatus Hydrogenedentota bacterium]HPG65413.1 glycosyltransferase [Candidatus Hydrogenedentota bacterium]
MDVPRLDVSARFRELMSYDKLAGDVPRMLVMQSGYWLDAACLNAAKGLGWQVRAVPVQMKGVLKRENIRDLLMALGEFQPDFVLSINMSAMDVQGLFARLFEDIKVPYVTWFVDDPRTILVGRNLYASAYTVALTWEKAYIESLRALGFPEVRYLPLAVDPTLFSRAPAESAEGPPAFVGHSMNCFATDEWRWAEDHPPTAQAVRAAFAAGRVTRQTFAQGLEAFLDAALLSVMDEDQRRHAELLTFVEGTRRLRRSLMEALEPEGVEVYGDEAWGAITARAKGFIDYEHDLAGHYNACAVNVNCTSIQMASAVNQRVFDCPAAGGFLITDSQADLEELFDAEQEIVRYGSPEECRALVAGYLRHPAARREMVLRARARVLGEHTYARRLDAIVEIIRERFA